MQGDSSDLASGLLGDQWGGPAAAVAVSSMLSNLAGNSPAPNFEHLEGRAVTAAFLRKFRSENITPELERRATTAAIPYLGQQILRRENEIRDLLLVEAASEGVQLKNARRWLEWLQMDLKRRRQKPFVTARDVHRYIIKPATDDKLCRYCELPGLAEARDPDTGVHYFGDADHFFSYNWDSPFDDVVDAVCVHSAKQEATGNPPQHYFIDNFAMIQHYKTSTEDAAQKLAGNDEYGYDSTKATWGKATTACPDCPNCPGPWDRCYECPCQSCVKGCYDMTDWERRTELLNLHGDDVKIHGFERVIQYTQSTVMLMEPWWCPRAPTRVWCLFEGNATLRYGGKLQAVLGSAQENLLRLSLGKKFSELEAIVSGVDSRTADATGEDDKTRIFAAIEQLPGQYDEMDRNLQNALRIWLADAAESVLDRTDPCRPALADSTIELELRECGDDSIKLAQFLEAWPHLPRVMAAIAFLVFVGWIAALGIWLEDPSASGAWAVAAVLMFLVQWVLWNFASRWMSSQRMWQLRQVPPLIGGTTAAQNYGVIGVISFTSTLLILPAVAWMAFDWQQALVTALFSTFVMSGAIWEPIVSFRIQASVRAELGTKAGWLRLGLGDTERAIEIFSRVQEESQLVCGNEDLEESYIATAGLLRALCVAGRTEEAEALIDEIPEFSIGEWTLLHAGFAVAMRQPDSEVLAMLKEAAEEGCSVQVGTRRAIRFSSAHQEGASLKHMFSGAECSLPEWTDFLDRMSTGSCEAADCAAWAALPSVMTGNK